jgi:hypothetical protein
MGTSARASCPRWLNLRRGSSPMITPFLLQGDVYATARTPSPGSIPVEHYRGVSICYCRHNSRQATTATLQQLAEWPYAVMARYRWNRLCHGQRAGALTLCHLLGCQVFPRLKASRKALRTTAWKPAQLIMPSTACTRVVPLPCDTPCQRALRLFGADGIGCYMGCSGRQGRWGLRGLCLVGIF